MLTLQISCLREPSGGVTATKTWCWKAGNDDENKSGLTGYPPERKPDTIIHALSEVEQKAEQS